MSLEEALFALKIDGFYLIEGVMPPEEADKHRKGVEQALADAGGHIEGSMFINYYQGLAPYFDDERILGVAQALFGMYTRIISTGMLISEPHPGGKPGAPGGYHSDWPFGQSGASYVNVPIPDVMMNLVTFWMLTDFTKENGATVVVPGTHRATQNPNGDPNLRKGRLTELQVTAPRGSVVLFDGRLWHNAGSNYSNDRRIFHSVSYGPWWLNCHARRPDSVEHRIQTEAGHHAPAGHWPYVKGEVYDRLPESVKPLFRHWLDREWEMSLSEGGDRPSV